jgi:diacylglycerol kinase family enzyme
MKEIAIRFLLVILFSGFSLTLAQAQSKSLFADVRSALKAGSSKELSQHFHDNIELNIDGESGNYSNVHAEIYLKEFFKKHEPISFEYAHQGGSPEGLNYAIGNYVHSEGTYLVLIRAKKIDGKEKIYIIDFSKE